MAQLAPLPSPTLALPALLASADDRARLRFLEVFAVTIRNAHTRRAHAPAAGDFLTLVDRHSGGYGKSVSVRVAVGGGRIIKKQTRIQRYIINQYTVQSLK